MPPLTWAFTKLRSEPISKSPITGPGPLRRTILARLAPPRHPRDRRPCLPHRTAPVPKSSRAGLTLYQILGTLQNTLRCWTGICTTCHQPLPSRPPRQT